LMGAGSILFIIALLIIKKSIERAFELSEPFRYEVKIYKGAFYGCMPKQSFNGINISSLV
jgi:hypothetical protein